MYGWWSLGFFFQAEDGIRDPLVTGVQTCALPIYARALCVEIVRAMRCLAEQNEARFADRLEQPIVVATRDRKSVVREECRSRWSLDDEEKKRKASARARTDAKSNPSSHGTRAGAS